jgi:hypothetical protein
MRQIAFRQQIVHRRFDIGHFDNLGFGEPLAARQEAMRGIPKGVPQASLEKSRVEAPMNTTNQLRIGQWSDEPVFANEARKVQRER